MSFLQNACRPKGGRGKQILRRMNKSHARLAQWGFSHVETKEDAQVLDIGCGGGANVAVWLKDWPRAQVTGVDYSEVSVKETIRLNDHFIRLGRCRVLRGDVSNLPFEDESFDYISAFETVYFWPSPEKDFGQVYRVLRKGGKFMICNEADGTSEKQAVQETLIQGMKIYTAEQLTGFLENAGFSKIATDTKKENNWLCIVAEK